MKLFEKGQRHIVVILAIFIIISACFFMVTVNYSSEHFVEVRNYFKIYLLFAVLSAIGVFIYTKRKFSQAENIETSLFNRKGVEAATLKQKEQDKIDREEQKRKALEQKRLIEEKLLEITSGLNEENELEPFFDRLLINVSKPLEIVQGVAYIWDKEKQHFRIISTYAYYTDKTDRTFEIGEGIPGQVAKDQKLLTLDNVPDNYIQVVSGLGNSSPKHLVEIPLVDNKQTLAILELASFSKPEVIQQVFFTGLNERISHKIASMIEKL